MDDVNLVQQTGRVTMKPNLRSTPSGVPVCDVYFASNRRRTDGKQVPTFLTVTLWNKQAEWAGENLQVGDFIFVTGMLVDNNFVDKDTGKKTSGRLKIEKAFVRRLQSSQPKEKAELPEEEPVQVPEV